MSDFDLTRIALLLLLLICSGFFSGSETAFFSLGRIERYRIAREKGSIALRWIHDLIQQPRRLLITILIGNECVNITASAVSAKLSHDLCSRLFPAVAEDTVLLETLVAAAFILPLILIFGEVTPKTVALLNPRRFAKAAVVPLTLFARAVAPVRLLLESLASGIVRATLGESPPADQAITEREFRSMVDLSKLGGELGETEQEFIHNIFEFGETQVSELMTSRADMVCLHADQPLPEALRTVEEHHFSRIPVYHRDMDDIVGILYAKDLLRDALEADRGEPWSLRQKVRKPSFIPQTKRANDLFREFRTTQVHLAMVVDEYGGVAGLVTMDDLLEDLFGDIIDEHRLRVPQVRRLGQDTLIIPGRMPIEDFNRLAGAALSDDEYDTMGGFVFGLFGRLPSVGSRVSYKSFAFTIEKMRGTRIGEIRVQRQPSPGADTGAAPPGTPGGGGEGSPADGRSRGEPSSGSGGGGRTPGEGEV